MINISIIGYCYWGPNLAWCVVARFEKDFAAFVFANQRHRGCLIRFFIREPINSIQRCLDFDSDDLARVGSRTIALSSGSGGIS
jgi:hypothetical protein